MDIKLKLKTIGHPVVLFGENHINITERIFSLRFFFLGKLKKKFCRNNRTLTFFPKNWLKRSLNLIYFSKTETRKKRYEINRKIKELFLSTRGIDNCLNYDSFQSKKKNKLEKNSEISRINPFPVYQLILRFKANKNHVCFEAGETGVFSLNSSDKIVLNDLQNNKTSHIVNSNLNSINHLSAHPTFPLCLLASTTNCSEFWKISSFNQKTSLYNIYHKDPIIFQKYRKKDKFVDFGTSNMKWKCLDETTQKFIFSHQFDENIVDISVNKDSQLSVIKTIENIYLFDNRNNKRISKFKNTDEKSLWIDRVGERYQLNFIENGFILYGGKHKQIQTNNNFKLNTQHKLKINEHSKLLILKRRKVLKILNIISKSCIQIINFDNNMASFIQNESGSLVGLLYKKQINILKIR